MLNGRQEGQQLPVCSSAHEPKGRYNGSNRPKFKLQGVEEGKWIIMFGRAFGPFMSVGETQKIILRVCCLKKHNRLTLPLILDQGPSMARALRWPGNSGPLRRGRNDRPSNWPSPCLVFFLTGPRSRVRTGAPCGESKLRCK